MRFFEQVHGVYFDDLDAFQILHNARYLLLMERTIGEFWQKMDWGNLLDPQRNPDQFHVVAANQVDYHRPVVGVGQVRCRIWVERLGRSSMTFGFSVLPTDEDEPFATGTRVIVKIDPDSRQPVPWSDPFRVALQPYCRATG